LAEFGISPEDKFKLSLLSVEKRFVELEGAIGEMQQKLQNIQAPDTKDLEQRISDLEDLIYVEQGGIEELKGMLEGQKDEKESSNQQVAAEEVQKIVDPILAKAKSEIDSKLDHLKNGLDHLRQTSENNPQIANQMNEMNGKVAQLNAKINAIHHFRAELDTLRSKVEPMKPEMIRSIVAEVSDLRIDTGREIRELKEKVGNAPLYADIQFLSNRVKDLKMTVDNLLNMKVEIDAKLLNMERNMSESGTSGSSAVASNLISEVEDTKRMMFGMQKRITNLDSTNKELMRRLSEKGIDTTKQMEMSREVETLYTKMNDLYSSVEKKAMDMNRLAPTNFSGNVSELKEKIARLEEQMQQREAKPSTRYYDDQMKEFLEKIILLETRINVLETHIVESQRNQPMILE